MNKALPLSLGPENVPPVIGITALSPNGVEPTTAGAPLVTLAEKMNVAAGGLGAARAFTARQKREIGSKVISVMTKYFTPALKP